MALFGKKKADETVRNDNENTVGKAGVNVKILGSGCKKCNELETNAKAALEELGMDTTIDHVADFGQIAAYGVMTTPALVFDKKVVSVGKVLKKDEIIALIKKHGVQK